MRSGNVVLVEAFVVLSLVFMIQFVLAATASDDAIVVENRVFSATFKQLETGGNTANHFAFVVINGAVISLGGSDNCPDGVLTRSPLAYPSLRLADRFVASDTAVENNFSVNEPDELDALKTHFAEYGLTIDQNPDPVGYSINISGDLDLLPEEGLTLTALMCRCYFPVGPGLDIGRLEHPHPLSVDVFSFSDGQTNAQEFFGYHHTNDSERDTLPGLLSQAFNGEKPSNPYRRFEIYIDKNGLASSTHLKEISSGS